MEKEISKEMQHKSKLKNFTFIHKLIFAFMIIWVITLIILLLWGFITSLKTSRDFLTNKVLLPKGSPLDWAYDNYLFVIKNYYVPVTDASGVRNIWIENMIGSSLIYSFGAPATALIVSCWVAHLTSRFNYKFSKFVFSLVIVVMFIPTIGSTVSTVVILKNLSIFDTYISIFVLNFSFMGTNYLLFYANLKAMPKDFIEAAKIDGAGEFTIFLRIVLPSVSTLFSTLFILGAITAWNNYDFAIIFLPTHPNLAYGVFSLTSTTLQGFNHVPVRMASYYLLALPILIVFMLIKNYLIENMNFSLGELKG